MFVAIVFLGTESCASFKPIAASEKGRIHIAGHNIPYFIYGKGNMTINGVTSNTSVTYMKPQESGVPKIVMRKRSWKID